MNHPPSDRGKLDHSWIAPAPIPLDTTTAGHAGAQGFESRSPRQTRVIYCLVAWHGTASRNSYKFEILSNRPRAMVVSCLGRIDSVPSFDKSAPSEAFLCDREDR